MEGHSPGTTPSESLVRLGTPTSQAEGNTSQCPDSAGRGRIFSILWPDRGDETRLAGGVLMVVMDILSVSSGRIVGMKPFAYAFAYSSRDLSFSILWPDRGDETRRSAR